MDSNFSLDDVDDILDDFDDDLFNEKDGSTAVKRSSSKWKFIIPISIILILSLLSLFFFKENIAHIVSSGKNTSTTQSSSEDGSNGDENSPGATDSVEAQPEQYDLSLINLEQVSYGKLMCEYTENMSSLKSIPKYDKPENLNKVRNDIVLALENNIKIISENQRVLEGIPQRSHDEALSAMSQQSITEAYKAIGNNPDGKNISNTLIVMSAMDNYKDSLRSMVDDLKKPATYDAYGLNKYVSRVKNSFESVNKSFNEELSNAFTVNNYDNVITLQSVSENNDCGFVDINKAGQENKVVLEEQEKIYNKFISDRCYVFMNNASQESSTIGANRKLCEEHIDNFPVQNNKYIYNKEDISSQKQEIEELIDYSMLLTQ